MHGQPGYGTHVHVPQIANRLDHQREADREGEPRSTLQPADQGGDAQPNPQDYTEMYKLSHYHEKMAIE